MIQVKYKGRLGNNIFQYVMGRIIAEEHGLYLDAKPLPYFINTNKEIKGRKLLGNPKKIGKRHNINIYQKIQQNAILKGYFHIYDHYKNHKYNIRDWLWLEKSNLINKYNINNNDVVVHYRLTDYKHKLKWNLSIQDIETMLNNIQYNNMFVCSDDINDENIKILCKKYNATIIDENEIETFKLIKAFNNIVLSPSTYSWWAAWLSDANKIILPWKSNTPWSNENKKKSGSDLRIYDEERYIIEEL